MAHIYPRQVEPDSVFTQNTLDRLTTSILSWQQEPGHFGGLHLHPCWGDTSAITRRYHGQTIGMAQPLLHGAAGLFAATGALDWRKMADDVISNILFLQAPSGGFIHAAAEQEPAYVPEMTCPIHQFTPIVALLEYAGWAHANQDLQAQIRPAIDRRSGPWGICGALGMPFRPGHSGSPVGAG